MDKLQVRADTVGGGIASVQAAPTRVGVRATAVGRLPRDERIGTPLDVDVPRIVPWPPPGFNSSTSSTLCSNLIVRHAGGRIPLAATFA